MACEIGNGKRSGNISTINMTPMIDVLLVLLAIFMIAQPVLLKTIDHIRMPDRPAKEGFVPSSLQFSLTGLTDEQTERFVQAACDHGVFIKWFGAADAVGFTSRHDHWRYLHDHNSVDVPTADSVLHGLCDFRLPVWMTPQDCAVVAAVLSEAMIEVVEGR